MPASRRVSPTADGLCNGGERRAAAYQATGATTARARSAGSASGASKKMTIPLPLHNVVASNSRPLCRSTNDANALCNAAPRLPARPGDAIGTHEPGQLTIAWRRAWEVTECRHRRCGRSTAARILVEWAPGGYAATPGGGQDAGAQRARTKGL